MAKSVIEVPVELTIHDEPPALLKSTPYLEAIGFADRVWLVAARRGKPVERGFLVVRTRDKIRCECPASSAFAWCAHTVVVQRIINATLYDAWRWENRDAEALGREKIEDSFASIKRISAENLRFGRGGERRG